MNKNYDVLEDIKLLADNSLENLSIMYYELSNICLDLYCLQYVEDTLIQNRLLANYEGQIRDMVIGGEEFLDKFLGIGVDCVEKN